MKKLTLILTLIIGIILTSCTNSEFQGEWKGTYTGKADKGYWSATIDENGVISGKAESPFSKLTFELTGKVNDNGIFTAVYGNPAHKGYYNGKFTKDTVIGTWSNPKMNFSGKINGAKK
ncbi:hypothetical protein [Polaribacter septentrionalilitoris]|uniref:hypothetical protein n=1 Tax=Polaribacter septentrionalilitoris TaxID=2494657 RepID=UPI001358B2B1|nr:hypothetical protein [Polaribacter septentrionalilitoris]